MFDKFHDECGIFGIFNHEEAARYAYLGLHALQHRGQESAGICTDDGERLHVQRVMGLVAENFTEDVLQKLPGRTGIGHVRYSTAGGSHPKNAQPFQITFSMGQIAVAHNGNLVNAGVLRRQLESQGSIFQATMDTEIFVHLIARSKKPTIEERIVDACRQVQGAYSLLFLVPGKLIAVRDPFGFRPLVLGKHDGSWVLASETTALSLIDAAFVREIEPGEMVVIQGDNELQSMQALPAAPHRRQCIFEFVYFARPDSFLFGHNVNEVRKRMGEQLARESGVAADVVIPVPDSGVPAAIGYARASGIPFEMGFIRSHYIGRTFIEPTQQIRHFGVKLKLLPVRAVIEGRRVVVIDDSIVRSTTAKKIVKMLWDAGAKEVHMRVSSPPTISPCYYGIDTPTKSELIAATHSVGEIREMLNATTLAYLSLEGMIAATRADGDSFCHACFSEQYPIPFPYDCSAGSCGCSDPDVCQRSSDRTP
ncbi:MAG: amidophosphoribosyltransferase [Myxococcales bacterium]|nr:MAG: amidophosphoribosyltransferase [Myxococcales bacterium]